MRVYAQLADGTILERGMAVKTFRGEPVEYIGCEYRGPGSEGRVFVSIKRKDGSDYVMSYFPSVIDAKVIKEP